jgi:molybdopterin/thiamine biosynthesis adenylyltransferase
VFTVEQVQRYSRHMLLPEVGVAGQQKLLDAKVLVIGAGGLGSPVLYYLAAAGVGTLGVVDFDVVDRSNLQRQILHRDDRLGMLKTESAELTLTGLNPDVTVVRHDEPLTSENALDVMRAYDIIVNGCDNFPTRYLVNDAAYMLGKPIVDGSIMRFEGMTTVFEPGKGCYRCLYPSPPPPEMAPSCSEAGVLGVLPGLIGLIQATETTKLIIGIGTPLTGRLLLVDALDMEFRELKLRRDPECPLCGDHPTVTELIDYEEFCGFVGGDAAPAAVEAGVAG